MVRCEHGLEFVELFLVLFTFTDVEGSEVLPTFVSSWCMSAQYGSFFKTSADQEDLITRSAS